MTDSTTSRKKKGRNSPVSTAFVENNAFLKKFLSRFLSNQQDIEDVAQEAFLRAYVAEMKKDISQPKAFLFQIAKNVALTKLTTKSKQITDYIEEMGAPVIQQAEASTENEVEAQELLGQYFEAVASLPNKCRETYLLRKVHGLSHREIADRMSLSISSVEKYLRQGILTCKGLVDEAESHKVRSTRDSVIRKVPGKPSNEKRRRFSRTQDC